MEPNRCVSVHERGRRDEKKRNEIAHQIISTKAG